MVGKRYLFRLRAFKLTKRAAKKLRGLRQLPLFRLVEGNVTWKVKP